MARTSSDDVPVTTTTDTTDTTDDVPVTTTTDTTDTTDDDGGMTADTSTDASRRAAEDIASQYAERFAEAFPERSYERGDEFKLKATDEGFEGVPTESFATELRKRREQQARQARLERAKQQVRERFQDRDISRIAPGVTDSGDVNVTVKFASGEYKFLRDVLEGESTGPEGAQVFRQTGEEPVARTAGELRAFLAERGIEKEHVRVTETDGAPSAIIGAEEFAGRTESEFFRDIGPRQQFDLKRATEEDIASARLSRAELAEQVAEQAGPDYSPSDVVFQDRDGDTYATIGESALEREAVEDIASQYAERYGDIFPERSYERGDEFNIKKTDEGYQGTPTEAFESELAEHERQVAAADIASQYEEQYSDLFPSREFDVGDEFTLEETEEGYKGVPTGSFEQTAQERSRRRTRTQVAEQAGEDYAPGDVVFRPRFEKPADVREAVQAGEEIPSAFDVAGDAGVTMADVNVLQAYPEQFEQAVAEAGDPEYATIGESAVKREAGEDIAGQLEEQYSDLFPDREIDRGDEFTLKETDEGGYQGVLAEEFQQAARKRSRRRTREKVAEKAGADYAPGDVVFRPQFEKPEDVREAVEAGEEIPSAFDVTGEGDVTMADVNVLKSFPEKFEQAVAEAGDPEYATIGKAAQRREAGEDIGQQLQQQYGELFPGRAIDRGDEFELEETDEGGYTAKLSEAFRADVRQERYREAVAEGLREESAQIRRVFEDEVGPIEEYIQIRGEGEDIQALLEPRLVRRTSAQRPAEGELTPVDEYFEGLAKTARTAAKKRRQRARAAAGTASGGLSERVAVGVSDAIREAEAVASTETRLTEAGRAKRKAEQLTAEAPVSAVDIAVADDQVEQKAEKLADQAPTVSVDAGRSQGIESVPADTQAVRKQSKAARLAEAGRPSVAVGTEAAEAKAKADRMAAAPAPAEEPTTADLRREFRQAEAAVEAEPTPAAAGGPPTPGRAGAAERIEAGAGGATAEAGPGGGVVAEAEEFVGDVGQAAGEAVQDAKGTAEELGQQALADRPTSGTYQYVEDEQALEQVRQQSDELWSLTKQEVQTLKRATGEGGLLSESTEEDLQKAASDLQRRFSFEEEIEAAAQGRAGGKDYTDEMRRLGYQPAGKTAAGVAGGVARLPGQIAGAVPGALALGESGVETAQSVAEGDVTAREAGMAVAGAAGVAGASMARAAREDPASFAGEVAGGFLLGAAGFKALEKAGDVASSVRTVRRASTKVDIDELRDPERIGQTTGSNYPEFSSKATSGSTRRAVEEFREVAGEAPKRVKETVGSERVLYHGTQQKFPKSGAVEAGSRSELSGQYVSADPSDLRLGGRASGVSSGKVSFVPSVREKRKLVMRGSDEGEIRGVPDRLGGSRVPGEDLDKPITERTLLGREKTVGREKGRVSEYIIEEGGEGEAYVLPRGTRTSEQEAVVPEGTPFQATGETVAVRMGPGDYIPGKVYRYGDPDAGDVATGAGRAVPDADAPDAGDSFVRVPESRLEKPPSAAGPGGVYGGVGAGGVAEPTPEAPSRRPTPEEDMNTPDAVSPAPPSRGSSGRPSVGEPSVGEPSVGEPSVGEPSVGEPSVGEPSVGEPSVGEPSVGEPSVGEPSVGEPSVGEPSVGEPSVGEPSVGEPSVGEPSVGEPSVGEPSVGEPSVGEPSVGEPSVGEPSVGEPSVGEPSVGEPSVGEPSVGEPSVGEPSWLPASWPPQERAPDDTPDEPAPIREFDVETSETGTPYATGWFNEFVVGYATGAGPREAPGQATLADVGGAASLTEQLPTMTELSGTEAEQEAIEEAEALFFVDSGEEEPLL